MIDYNLIQLDNGLNILVIKRPGFESVESTFYIKTGSAYENKNNNGISHLLEHLLFYNRKKPELYPFGSEINAFTRKDFTYYEAVASKKHLPDIFYAFQKVIFEPEFTPSILKTIKKIAKEEIEDGKDNPFEVLNNEIDPHLYPETPLSLPVLGNKKNIDRITLKDLNAWHQIFYQPENMILAVAGDLSVSEVKKWADYYFKFNSEKQKEETSAINSTPQTKDKNLTIKSKNFQRGYLALVYPASKTLGSDFAKYSFLWNLINQKIRPAVESSDLFYDMEFLYLYDLFRGEYQATFSS
ncbi:MAG: pitrilysin family protein, partial [Candidatus Moraniibacteriota bacterium]